MALDFENNPNTESLASVSAFTPPSNNGSFSFWINLTSLVANIRRFFGSAGNFEMRGGNGSGTQPPGQVVNDMYNNSDGALSTTELSQDTWYHVVGIGELDGVPNSITSVYINGVLDGGPTTVAGAAVAAATMTIGNRTGAANTEGLNGLIEDFRVYNRELSAAEIATIHAARGVDGIVEGLVMRVPMREGADGTNPSGAGFVKDVSDAKNNFTATGSPAYASGVIRSRRRTA